jgi:hypothetical protein
MARLSRTAAPARIDQRWNAESCAAFIVIPQKPKISGTVAPESLTYHPRRGYEGLRRAQR